MSKLKKIGLIAFIVIVVLSAVFAYFMIKIQDDLDYLNLISIQDVDLELIDDGTYTGEYDVFPIHVILEVEVENHEIIDITILLHENGQGGPAEAIIEDVIEEQTLQVDAIAGATYSSKVILLAIEDALNSALQ